MSFSFFNVFFPHFSMSLKANFVFNCGRSVLETSTHDFFFYSAMNFYSCKSHKHMKKNKSFNNTSKGFFSLAVLTMCCIASGTMQLLIFLFYCTKISIARYMYECPHKNQILLLLFGCDNDVSTFSKQRCILYPRCLRATCT